MCPSPIWCCCIAQCSSSLWLVVVVHLHYQEDSWSDTKFQLALLCVCFIFIIVMSLEQSSNSGIVWVIPNINVGSWITVTYNRKNVRLKMVPIFGPDKYRNPEQVLCPLFPVSAMTNLTKSSSCYRLNITALLWCYIYHNWQVSVLIWLPNNYMFMSYYNQTKRTD